MDPDKKVQKTTGIVNTLLYCVWDKWMSPFIEVAFAVRLTL